MRTGCPGIGEGLGEGRRSEERPALRCCCRPGLWVAPAGRGWHAISYTSPCSRTASSGASCETVRTAASPTHARAAADKQWRVVAGPVCSCGRWPELPAVCGGRLAQARQQRPVASPAPLAACAACHCAGDACPPRARHHLAPPPNRPNENAPTTNDQKKPLLQVACLSSPAPCPRPPRLPAFRALSELPAAMDDQMAAAQAFMAAPLVRWVSQFCRELAQHTSR